MTVLKNIYSRDKTKIKNNQTINNVGGFVDVDVHARPLIPSNLVLYNNSGEPFKQFDSSNG